MSDSDVSAMERRMDDPRVLVMPEDANNYCLILSALGMEEEGDPVAEVRRLIAEVERLQRERAERSKADPVTRLHNICDALAEDRDTSPYSQQAWDAQDERYREKCKELEALRVDAGRYAIVKRLRWSELERIKARTAPAVRYGGGEFDAAIDAARESGNG